MPPNCIGPVVATGKIQRANLDGSQVADVVTGLSGNYGLAIDELHDRIYWSNINNGTISRANIDGTAKQTIIAGLSYPLTIALNPSAGLMYWTDFDKVKRATLDGGSVTNLVNIVPLASDYYTDAAGLALDLTNQRIYASALTGRIQRSNLDGTGLQLLTPRPAGLEGLTLDLVHSQIYLVDYRLGTIGRTALDGTGFQLLVSGLAGPEHVALDLAAGKMYWGETNGGQIGAHNLDGTGVQTIVANAPGVDTIRLVLDNVPEPSTLLLATLAMVIFAVRSKAVRSRNGNK